MRNLLLFIIIYVFVSLLLPDDSFVEAYRGGGRARYSRYRSRRYEYRYGYDSSGEYTGGGGGSSLSAGSIVGIVVGIIICVGLAIVLIYYFCK